MYKNGAIFWPTLPMRALDRLNDHGELDAGDVVPQPLPSAAFSCHAGGP